MKFLILKHDFFQLNSNGFAHNKVKYRTSAIYLWKLSVEHTSTNVQYSVSEHTVTVLLRTKFLRQHFESDSLIIEWTEAKFLVPDWGIKSTLAHD
jgi:hypothetical protein